MRTTDIGSVHAIIATTASATVRATVYTTLLVTVSAIVHATACATTPATYDTTAHTPVKLDKALTLTFCSLRFWAMWSDHMPTWPPVNQVFYSSARIPPFALKKTSVQYKIFFPLIKEHLNNN